MKIDFIAEAFLTRVHDAAITLLMAELSLDMREEWQGESKQRTNRVDGRISLQLMLTHKCGFCVSHKRVFPKPGDMTEVRSAGRILANGIKLNIRRHKCPKHSKAPHLTIVKPWLCPICGVTDEKFPEWEGECNHVQEATLIVDSKNVKSKNKRVRERIGGRKGPAKARRKSVEKARRGEAG